MNHSIKIPVIIILFIGSLISLTSCKEKATLPVVTTTDVTGITPTTASTGGNVTDDGGAEVTSKGVCWNTSESPTVANSKTSDGTGTGSFTSSLTQLIPNTKYYVKAYATNSAGTAYGNEISFTSAQLVTDFDGNVYHVVTIGTQDWLVENLKVTHYRNGDPIPNVTGAAEWELLSTGAYCNYDNLESNGTTYGRLYNWYAVSDDRNIAPEGWHVPSDPEWDVLITFLGGVYDAGGKLKEAGTTHWKDPNHGATNSSGFTALPAGLRNWAGGFEYIIWGCGFWSTTFQNDDATVQMLDYNTEDIFAAQNGHRFGRSVRCIRD